MERLIKHYSGLFDEIIRQERFFPNPLFVFHHLYEMTFKYYIRTKRSNIKNQQKWNFCWFFFASQPLKIIK